METREQLIELCLDQNLAGISLAGTAFSLSRSLQEISQILTEKQINSLSDLTKADVGFYQIYGHGKDAEEVFLKYKSISRDYE